MAKRKSGVNDIIYELDNDDIEISSEDEAKGNKKKRFGKQTAQKSSESQSIINSYVDDVIALNSSMDDSCNTESESNSQNGGKNSPHIILIENDQSTNNDELEIIEQPINKDSKKGSETVILNEDIAVDSPASMNEVVEIGCENKKPLITIRFRNYELANKYKNKIKHFIVDLMKLDSKETDILENDAELDLEIWPEDLNSIKQKTQENDNTDNLFFVDTDPNDEATPVIPKYTQGSTVISNDDAETPEPMSVLRRGPICFNCDGDHYLRDCQLPRNNTRIAGKRKNIPNKLGRYHVEDEQKYGHLIPGRISSQLRHALGLKRYELPLHIYRMRLLGYPPGWLEEARISHSGITMFDSAGNAILDADEEEGQICEAGSKDKFDIKKILDFPGFNVPASSRYKEEGEMLGMPPMSEHDSKLLMLQTLAPNAMKAYKRKKLTFFPSGTPNNSMQNSQAEMELDSGDEVAEFPSVPPLPDEAPPPPPPPPENPPPPPPESPPPAPSPPAALSPAIKNDKEPRQDTPTKAKSNEDSQTSEDLEIISVRTVADIPVPEDDLIVIDEYTESGCGWSSPTLDDLEDKKRQLLDALGEQTPSKAPVEIQLGNDGTRTEGNHAEVQQKAPEKTEQTESEVSTESPAAEQVTAAIFENPLPTSPEACKEQSASDVSAAEEIFSAPVSEPPLPTTSLEASRSKEPTASDVSIVDSPAAERSGTAISETPPPTKSLEASRSKSAGNVKTTLYGTPVLNIASPYMKLPSDENFAKDICDVINFENLPNSTGKYKKICSLLKKVKSEVDRIQES